MFNFISTAGSAQDSFADADHIITPSPSSFYSPETLFFGLDISSATQEVSLSDDERVAELFASLNAPLLSAETAFDSFYDFSSIHFVSPTQSDESTLMGPDNGSKDEALLASHLSGCSVVGIGKVNPASQNTEAFHNAKDCCWTGTSPITGSVDHDKGSVPAETRFASISPSSTLLAELGDTPSAALALTSEWLDLFPTPLPCGASVFQPSPEGFAAGDACSSSSGLDAEGLLSLLDHIPQSQIPWRLGELNVQTCGAELGHRNDLPHCSSPSSEGGSGAASQGPVPPSPASTLPVTPSATQAPASPNSGQSSPQTQTIEFNQEKPAPTLPNEPPQTFNFVFDLKSFDQEDRCECKKKAVKKRRHWDSCPSNPNKPYIPCPYCPGAKNKIFRGGSAMVNLQKHVRGFHPGEVVPRSRRR